MTFALLAVLFALVIGGYKYFSANRALDVAEREITTQIREGQSLAVSSGNTHRVFFDVSDSSFVLQRRSGSEWVNVHAVEDLPGSVDFDSANPPLFGGDAYLEFYARGVSESGQLGLVNDNGSTKTLQVEGETVNVSVSD